MLHPPGRQGYKPAACCQRLHCVSNEIGQCRLADGAATRSNRAARVTLPHAQPGWEPCLVSCTVSTISLILKSLLSAKVCRAGVSRSARLPSRPLPPALPVSPPGGPDCTLVLRSGNHMPPRQAWAPYGGFAGAGGGGRRRGGGYASAHDPLFYLLALLGQQVARLERKPPATILLMIGGWVGMGTAHQRLAKNATAEHIGQHPAALFRSPPMQPRSCFSCAPRALTGCPACGPAACCRVQCCRGSGPACCGLLSSTPTASTCTGTCRRCCGRHAVLTLRSRCAHVMLRSCCACSAVLCCGRCCWGWRGGAAGGAAAAASRPAHLARAFCLPRLWPHPLASGRLSASGGLVPHPLVLPPKAPPPSPPPTHLFHSHPPTHTHMHTHTFAAAGRPAGAAPWHRRLPAPGGRAGAAVKRPVPRRYRGVRRAQPRRRRPPHAHVRGRLFGRAVRHEGGPRAPARCNRVGLPGGWCLCRGGWRTRAQAPSALPNTAVLLGHPEGAYPVGLARSRP
jgi:hypothetical protein